MAEVKQQLNLTGTKLVLITNASMFHREHVQRALQILDENQGEIWAKLDAGTTDYFRQINRTRFHFETILQNITSAAIESPVSYSIALHAY